MIASTETMGEYLACDYILTRFQVKSALLSDPVYVLGGFNNYQKNKDNLMIYDENSRMYRCDILLKQGLYDYIYWVDTTIGDPYALEGSFYQTENTYDIIVYHKSFSDLTDQVIGYRSFRSKF